MGWRDLIVTSRPSQTANPEPGTGSFVNSVNFGTRDKRKFSLSIQESIQNPTHTEPLTELTELPKPASRWTPFVLQALAHLTLELDGHAIHLEPGAVFTATAEQAGGLLERFPTQLEMMILPPDLPVEPLQPGWLVCYRDRAGRLAGGCDDRANGTVQSCQWDGHAWTVHLTNGQRLPLSAVLSVAKTDDAGAVLSAWSVREHGYAGEGRRP